MEKSIFYKLMALVVAMCSLHCGAVEPEDHDTAYFYNTWQQMLDGRPVSMYVDPYIVMVDGSPFSVYFKGGIKVNETIKKQHIALSIGDSIWMINDEYIRECFKGDAKNIRRFSPLYFNDKVAYLISSASVSLTESLLGSSYEGVALDVPAIYYIDFTNRRVEELTSDYLSKLLEDYPDLKMRYEGMKDYKKQYIIEDFFFQYVDRATEDIMRPYIVDLMNPTNKRQE